MPEKRANVRLRQIRVFLEIVRQGSLVRASKILNITQSAVSKALKELETELGAKVIHRGRRGVRLTQVGEVFRQHATQSLVSYSRAIAAAQRPTQARERLRIGALPTTAGSIVPRAVASMIENGWDFSVFVQTGAYEDLVEKVRTGDLDFIIGRLISRDIAGMSFEAFYEEDISVVVAAEHPLVGMVPLTLNNILDFPIISSPTGLLVRDAVDDYFFACGETPPSTVIESVSEGFSRTYTIRYNAVWFVPIGQVETDLAMGTLVRLPIEHGTLRAVIGLTTRTNDALSSIGRVFVQTLRELATEI